MSHVDDRENIIENAANAAISQVFQTIWMHPLLTPTEARLAWISVIREMVMSTWIGHKNDAMREWYETPDKQEDPK